MLQGRLRDCINKEYSAPCCQQRKRYALYENSGYTKIIYIREGREFMQNSLKNYFRVFYNPYEQSIHFEFKGDKGWISLSEACELKKIENGKSVVLQNRSWEILREIDSLYNDGDAGIEVSFYGTETDFDDLNTIFHAKRSELKPPPFLIQHEQSDTLPSAKVAQEIIEKSYEEIKDEFAAYLPGAADYKNNEAIGDAITAFQDILKPKINLSVFGNYSKGKSSFINALIGEELLPVDTDPTTALIYEIEDTVGIREIRFLFNGENMHIRWEGDTYNYVDTDNSVSESAQELKNQIYKEAKGKSSAIEKMNAVLLVINQNASKIKAQTVENQNASKRKAQTVEISLPFRNPVFPSNDFSMSITDTPGSNTDTYGDEHVKVLEDALANQTNTLPILLMDRYFDATDNIKLRELVVGASKGIDLGNMLVVINKADEMTKNQFNIKQEILDSWRKYRIMYVSSVIALGAKKRDGEHWIDESARIIFNRVKNTFSDKDHEDFKELYKNNIFPDGISAYGTGGEGAGDLFVNSGFGAVFQEINEFARKYALYLKVKEAREYLLKALSMAREKCDEAQKELKATKQDEEKAKEKTKDNLVAQIEKQEVPDDYIKSICQKTEEFVSEDYDSFCDGILKKTEETLEKHRTQKDKEASERVKACHNEMVSEVNLFYEQVFPNTKAFVEEELHGIQQGCIDKILKIIRSNDNITDEAKRLIENINVNPPQYNASYKSFKDGGAFSKKFLIWGVKIKPKKYAKYLREQVDLSFGADVIQTPIETMAKTLKEWIEKKKNEYIQYLDIKSIVLIEYDEKIKKLQERIDDVTKRLDNLRATEDKLSNMLEFQHVRDGEQ